MAQYYFNLADEFGSRFATSGFPSRGFIKTPYLSISLDDGANGTRTAGTFGISSDGLTVHRAGDVAGTTGDPSNGLEYSFVRSPFITFLAEHLADFEVYFSMQLGSFGSPQNFTNNGINVFFRLPEPVDSSDTTSVANSICLAMGGRNNGFSVDFYYDENGDRFDLSTTGTSTTGSKGLSANANTILHTRYKFEGNTIKRKQWLNDAAEPDWDVDYSFSGIPSSIADSGMFGLAVVTNSCTITFIDLAIGSNGDVAPTTPVVNPLPPSGVSISGSVRDELGELTPATITFLTSDGVFLRRIESDGTFDMLNFTEPYYAIADAGDFISILYRNGDINDAPLDFKEGAGEVDPVDPTRKATGFVYDADGNPLEQEVVITSVGDSPVVLGKGVSNPIDGSYSIACGNWVGEVMAYTYQNYGDIFTPDVVLSVGDVVRPTTPNQYVYEVVTSGNAPSNEPTWINDGSVFNYGSATIKAVPLLEPQMAGWFATEDI